jgi:predicted anti-sigma-YlaC factor YlaD
VPRIDCPGNELLIEYAAGRLRGADSAAVERHMGECDGCRDFVGRQQAVFDALDAWDEPAVPADFDRRLQERIFRPSWRERALAALRPALTWKACRSPPRRAWSWRRFW